MCAGWRGDQQWRRQPLRLQQPRARGDGQGDPGAPPGKAQIEIRLNNPSQFPHFCKTKN